MLCHRLSRLLQGYTLMHIHKWGKWVTIVKKITIPAWAYAAGLASFARCDEVHQERQCLKCPATQERL